MSLSTRRTQRSLEQLDETPRADLTAYPAFRTQAPLPAAFTNVPDITSKASRDSEAGEPMIARLNRHMAAQRTTDVAPFGVARRTRRSAMVPAFGVLAAVALAAATFLHQQQRAVTTDVDPDVASPVGSDMANVPLTELRAVTPPDAAASRAASAIRALPNPPHHTVPVEPFAAAAVAAPETAKDAVLVPQPTETVTVAASAPQPMKQATASGQPTAAKEIAETKEVTSVRDREASSVDDGYRLFKAGAVDAARAVFQRGASRGEVDAAFALGVTYDPKSLTDAGITRVAPDARKAVYWYRRAHRMAQSARQRSPSSR